MKTIQDFINEQYNENIDAGIKYQTQYNDLLKFYGGNIPQSVQESFINNPNKDYILEAINTHNVDDLIAAINKYYSNKVKKIQKYAGRNNKYSVILTATTYLMGTRLKNDEEFKALLNFHGYYISQQILDGTLFIEPTYPHHIKLRSNDRLYHFTHKMRMKSILENGLRCKTSRYRYFPERIYLYRVHEHILQTKDGELTDKAKEFADLVCNDLDERCILKVDLSGMNIPLYEDTAIKTKNAVYTYNNIPPSCITVFKESI